jgi:hypothetical protein
VARRIADIIQMSMVDKLVKSNPKCRDGLWKKFDILGVVSETVIRQYIWYGELPFQSYNDVDRTFYESIMVEPE